MCGIAGWLGTLLDNEGVAEGMVKSLRHRGPDGQGIRSWPEATLVHTRLSIIDLSPNGAQPMSNEDGTVWTVFNGEIYNHHELRHKLEAKGYKLKGRSDAEVLPHLYEEFGPECVHELRGMFALAIYDTRTNTLLLARDRFGIKPLFYARTKDVLAFGSEINTLLAVPGVDTQPNTQAIYDFAALFFIPAPETFFSGIRSLRPGEMLEAHLNREEVSWNTRLYHQWSINPDPSITLDQAADRADHLLRTAVRRQLESDVPFGALLSGGIDSSLVSVAAQEAMSGDLRTFNVRFSEKSFDETPAAVAVVEHIRSDHRTLEMDHVCGTWDEVHELLTHAGQPFADTSLFAMSAVCRLMRQHLKVALSGDGGDEGFGGYDIYWWIKLISRWKSIPKFARQGSSDTLKVLTWMGMASERLMGHVRELSSRDNTSIVQYLFSRIREEEHAQLCRQGHALPVRRLFEQQWEYRLPSRALKVEQLTALATEANIRLRLANGYLFKVDTASMKEGLEVRVPFLDEDLFEFCLSLPHNLKTQGQKCKRVLRHISKQWLPIGVATKRKQGFVIPFDTWTNKDFKSRVKESLLGSSSRLAEFFNPEVYEPMVQAFCIGQAYPGLSREALWTRVVMLLSVQLALEPRSV